MKTIIVAFLLATISGCCSKRVDMLEKNQAAIVAAVNMLGAKVMEEPKDEAKK
jgi:hypothetical protein